MDNNFPTSQLPPIPKLFNYPGTMTAILITIATTILVLVAAKFDPTEGPLTISIMVVSAFIGTVSFALFFNIPNDEITSAIIGGLVASFGAIIAYWLGRSRPPPKE